MSNTKLFYSYKDTKNTGKVTLSALSSYSDSIIFDEDNRRIWHNGKQYGNTYWGSKHGETFNDLDRNYAYSYAHAEGCNSYAGGEYSHVEGINNSAYGKAAHSEGDSNIAYGYYSHAEGTGNYNYGRASHAEGGNSYAGGQYSHVEGMNNSAYGKAAHTEGSSNIAYGYYSHVEGTRNYNYGIAAHSEGHYNVTYGDYSHVEGTSNYNYGTDAHIEGDSNIAYGYYSHTEGTNNSIYGTAAHVEGYHNVAYGYYSHAEGEYSYTIGKGSHTQGLGTVAYNNYEAAFGQYNESINGGNNPTIYSIGDGTSSTQRHNIIDFRKNGDMHKNGSSYFHNNIYGPVSYTYVSSLGETATLDIVLSSMLTQPEYTRPNIKVQYKVSTGGFTTPSAGSYTETVELGTYFIPKFQVSWPTRTQSNTSGTRAYDAVCIPSKPNYLLGYSYGVVPKGYKYPDGSSAANNGIFISYNNCISLNTINSEKTDPTACNKTLYAYALDTTYYGATSPCYILGEDTYTLFSNLQITYLPFSKMYFQQLYDKGAYVHAMGLPPTEWLNGGVSKLGGFKVNGRLKYFCGFSGTEYKLGQNYPKTISALRGGSYLGWLPISSDSSSSGVKEITIGPIGATNASKYCFWIAYPDSNDSSNSTNTIKSKHYKLVAQSSSFKIQVKPESALASDLIGDINKLKYAHLDDVTLAENGYKTRYKIAYIDFQKPLNIASHKIIFKIATSAYNSAQELPESN